MYVYLMKIMREQYDIYRKTKFLFGQKKSFDCTLWRNKQYCQCIFYTNTHKTKAYNNKKQSKILT